MPAFIDLTGQRFGKLVVLRRTGTTQYGQPIWLAVCDCGSEKTYFGNSLRGGASRSCGCTRAEALTTHGKTKTREFTIWQMMRQRCNNASHVSYPQYGGRGIKVCEKWDKSFSDFLNDMGCAPSSKHTLDRIKNDGPYSAENCRWATPAEQGMNKRNNRLINLFGETKPLAEWCRITGIAKTTILNRINGGMSEYDAFTKPVLRKRKDCSR